MSDDKKKKIDREKLLKGFQDTFGAKYDSDSDLTEKERKKIKYSSNPDKVRKELWEKKGAWDKTKKMMKTGWYGDKRRKKKPLGADK